MDLLLVGLGNPGRQYDATRHNVGFDFIEHLSKKYDIHLKRALFLPAQVGKGIVDTKKCILVKPQTYMNRSGDIFPKIFNQTNTTKSNLLVVCDNLDLPVGEARLKLKGSSGGQKGLKSISAKIGTEDFMRLFIGIGRPESRDGVVGHVLSKPNRADQEKIANLIDFISTRLFQIEQNGIEWVINEINSRRAD